MGFGGLCCPKGQSLSFFFPKEIVMIMFSFNSVKNDVQNNADTVLKIPGAFHFLVSLTFSGHCRCFICLEEAFFSSRPGRLHMGERGGKQSLTLSPWPEHSIFF